MDSVIRIIEKVEGEEEIKRLNKAHEQARESLVKLNEAFRAGAISQAQYQSQAAVIAQQMQGIGRQVQGIEAKVGSARGLTTFLQQSAYLADDLQYGMRGIGNNLAPILGAMGKWGSILAIVAVGSYQVYTHWRQLTQGLRSDLIDNSGSALDRLTERMQELQKQTLLTTREWRELKDAQEAVAGMKFEDQQVKAPTEEAEAVKKGFGEGVKQEGYGRLQGATQDALTSKFLRSPYEALEEAIRNRQLKDDHGNVVTERDARARGYKSGGAYDQKLKGDYLNQVIPNMVRDLLRRIGEGGDKGAVKELEALLKATGRYQVDDQGKVTDAKGNAVPALSAVLGTTKERRAQRAEDVGDADRVAEELDESNKRFHKQEEGRKKKAEDLARPMQDRATERILTARQNGFSPDQIQAAEKALAAQDLAKSGMDPAKAGRAADYVAKVLIQGADKAERDRALKEGVGLPEARAGLLNDAAEKRTKDAESKAADAERKARDANPGLDKPLLRRLMSGELQGSNPAEIDKALAAELRSALERQGMNAEDAGAAADRIVADDRKKLEASLTEARENPREGREHKSEIHEAAGFSKVLLTARSGVEEKSVRIQEKMLDQLAGIRELQERGLRNPPVARLS